MGLALHDVVASWKKDSVSLAHNVSFEARSGEWVAIVGQNGIGKSTLLHAVAGETPIAQGQILLDDVPLPVADRYSRFLAGVQLVRQHAAFPTSLTFSDAVAMAFEHRPGLRNTNAITDLLNRLKAVHLLTDNQPPHPRILDLVVAVLTVPRVLLLDEIGTCWRPPKMESVAIYRLLKELLPKTIVIFSEHDTRVARQVADKFAWLQDDGTCAIVETSSDHIKDLMEKLCKTVAPESARAQEHWDLIRLDHSPLEHLQLALQAAVPRSRRRALIDGILSDFPFLVSTNLAEDLSGGQRVVLLALVQAIARDEDIARGHLSARTEDRVDHWRKEIMEATRA